MADSSRAALGRRLLLPSLAALSFGLAFAQRPGETVADTRIELSADPGLFLDRVAWVWSATTDLGHVQSGQFVGYLFPMAPYFAAGDALAVPMWVLQRAWLGTLIFLAAWGAVRLMDVMLERRSVVAQAGAALVFALSPYVVLFTSRGTVTLLTYAALPWLMLAVHQGLRRPRGWRWPALFGLLLAATGGGVNAAVIAFALVGPIALVGYELFVGGVDRPSAWSFGWRAALAGALGSAWWAIPLLLQSRYGADFLLFTEQPRTIWGTTSLPELMRGLGFWGLYTGVGYGQLEPFMRVAGTYLFNPAVIVATFAVPLFAFGSLRLTRGWRYGPFFVLLAVVALLLMFAGFPEGTRLRSGLVDLYNDVEAVQFLRTTYKAAPLLALSLACLGGAGAAALAERARLGALRLGGRRIPAWTLAGLVILPLGAAAPLLTGRAIDRQQAYGEVPNAWTAALRDADRAQPTGTGTMVLPGELFGWYRWGGTLDPIGPALSRRPVAIREIVPYAGARSSQLQIAVDDLVQQDRLVPGQLGPLLRLLDVGQVLVAADSRRVRSGALDPVSVERALAGQTGLASASRSYGERRTYFPPPGRSGAPLRAPDIARRPVTGVQPPGGVRLRPLTKATILEGDAEGIPELAALGLLDTRRTLFYAGDLDRRRLRELVSEGAPLVLSDSARRRVFVAARLRSNRGATLGPDDPISPDSPSFDPFPGRGNAGRTVALYTGIRRIYTRVQPGFSQFPQFRPFAAVDGRLDTSWLADENVPSDDWYLHVDLSRPLAARSLSIVPHANRHGRTAAVFLSVNGGSERRIELAPGENRVPVDARTLTSLNVRIAKIVGDEDTRGAGGIAELRVPGLRVRERLRLPTALADETRGLDLSRNEVTVALERTTADFPYRAGADVGEPEDHSGLGMVDAEPGLQREVDLPAARSFEASGWASVSPRAPDDAIDRLVGLSRRWRFASSSRFEGVPGRRASSAFDGNPRTSWVGDLTPGREPFLAWRSPRPVTVRRVRLLRAAGDYAFPTRIRVAGLSAPVGPSGAVVLPRAVRARSLRLEVTAATRARLRAVGVAEVSIPGLRPPPPRRRGRFRTACGELRGRAGMTIDVTGDVAALDAGRPLRLGSCGRRGRLALPAGRSRLSFPAGAVMRPDHLALRSPAPRPVAVGAPAGRVVAEEQGGPPGAPRRARLDVVAPAWLVLTQSYNPGWRAWCETGSGDERELGKPIAVDGYANGWRVGRECREARFAFVPQRAATAGFVLSAVACLVLLAVLVASLLRRRRAPPVAAEADAISPPPADPLVRAGWPAALAAAAGVAVVTGPIFALRMGAVLGLLTLVLLRVGVNVGRLVAIAIVAIAALPVIYVVFPATDKGGYSFQYASDQIYAHWVAVVGVCCLAAAGALSAVRLRRSRTQPPSALPGGRAPRPRVPVGAGRRAGDEPR
jgi:arabinofuranan 3-O-arabinosyltransferase